MLVKLYISLLPTSRRADLLKPLKDFLFQCVAGSSLPVFLFANVNRNVICNIPNTF